VEQVWGKSFCLHGSIPLFSAKAENTASNIGYHAVFVRANDANRNPADRRGNHALIPCVAFFFEFDSKESQPEVTECSAIQTRQEGAMMPTAPTTPMSKPITKARVFTGPPSVLPNNPVERIGPYLQMPLRSSLRRAGLIPILSCLRLYGL
jgi:hypothetical protein